MSYKRQELLTLRERLSSLTGVGVVRVAHCFSFCVVFVCLRPVSCVPTVAGVSGLSILDCPFGFLERLFDMFIITNYYIDIDEIP